MLLFRQLLELALYVFDALAKESAVVYQVARLCTIFVCEVHAMQGKVGALHNHVAAVITSYTMHYSGDVVELAYIRLL